MKMLIGIAFVALVLNAALALPAGSPSDDAEVINVPRRNRPASDADDETVFHDFKGIIDTGAGSGYPFLQPVPHPYAFNLGFFDSFEDIFRRLRTRLWPLTGESGSDEDGDFSFKVTPPKDANTTSTVKIVDGHRIEINDTVYGGDNSFFKVRVVNVRPLESGEDGNPVTSAPGKNDNTDIKKDDKNDDSDERREPLENENKKTNDNEIRGNLDEPEIAVAIEMLPTTNDEADVTNLNAEFVTDNTLGSGSVEAETNKAKDEAADMEDGESALVAELQDEEEELDSNSSGELLSNEQLRVDGAEDEEQPETADNFNESHDEAATAELTKDMDSMQLTQEADAKEERAEEEIVDDAADADAELTAELNEETNTDAVNAEFDAESISISNENQDNENEDGAEYSSMKHSNYAVNNHREDVSSSDDEDAEDTAEMTKEFNEEWESLAEDLGNKNDRDNDLSNDIDIYESAVPVDLSNDLLVNDIAASQPDFAVNPDAEFVDVDSLITNSSSAGRPKFEKLTMNSSSYQNFK